LGQGAVNLGQVSIGSMVAVMKTSVAANATPDLDDGLLTVSEMLAYLRITKPTLYNVVFPRVPVLRIGRSVRVRRSDLMSYLDELAAIA
jgi:excisionase family DNA binding protein